MSRNRKKNRAVLVVLIIALIVAAVAVGCALVKPYNDRIRDSLDTKRDQAKEDLDNMIEEYHQKSAPAFCAKAGMVDEVVDMPRIRDYLIAFADACYQNPKAICPFHQMLLPRIIRDFDNLYAKK